MFGPVNLWSYFPSNDQYCNYWDIYEDESAQESALKEEQDGYLACCIPSPVDAVVPVPSISIHIEWPIRRPDAHLRGKFSVLKDWGLALHSRHAKGVAHGNLTPKSVGVVGGRGVLADQRLSSNRVPPDDDVYDARWTATEFFRLEDSNPHPTKMSDIYSFACLMLQMLTRRVPYCGTKRPEQVVYLKYLGREPIDTQTPRIADHYVAFMRRCWSLEPEKRPTVETVIGFIHEEIERLRERHV